MRLPKFTIRALLVITALVALLIFVGQTFFAVTPRPYHSTEQIVQQNAHGGWILEVPPDIPGPYRTAGDDRSSAMPFQLNPGRPVSGTVTAGNRTRKFNYPGRSGVSFIVIFLENTDDQPTYMILSRVEDQ